MMNEKNPSAITHGDSNTPFPDAAKSAADMDSQLDLVPDFDDNFTIDVIIQKILQGDKQYDLSKINSAYEFAAEAHKNQKRSSGQPYIIHPLAVALTVLELGMDTDTICAALLHDVVEDTNATFEDLKKNFGLDVASLVDGVTKLQKMAEKSAKETAEESVYELKKQQQAKSINKMLHASTKDIRVMIIKLADRLHNIRTLKFRPCEKRMAVVYETLHIYAPIADRLGIRAIKEELEDLCLRYSDPFAYTEIEKKLNNKKEEREAFVQDIIERVKKALAESPYFPGKQPQVYGRVKSIYGLYKKCYTKHKDFEEIYDKYAVRIIVDDSVSHMSCHAAMAVMESTFRPVPNRYKNYIAFPKNNMYQSLHNVFISNGTPFEIQIRSISMHENAEYGIAAHWKYKEGIKGKDSLEIHVTWLRQILEAQSSSDDVEEIVHLIKPDINQEEILVLTPMGDTIELPKGSTVIDFAYSVHTEIGHKTVGAKVDGKMVSLEYQLEDGQICQIITTKDPEKGPNRAWLNIVKTSHARSKISSWFKKEKRAENIVEGRKELTRMFRKYRIDVPENELADFLKDDFRRHNCETIEDFFASIGYGGISLDKIITRIKDKYQKVYGEKTKSEPAPSDSDAENKGTIVFDGIGDMTIRHAHCCNPLPGDDIVGFLTRGYGISIHTRKCSNYRAAVERNNPEELARWRNVEWLNTNNSKIQTGFEVVADDRVGLVHDVTEVLLELKIHIVHSSSRTLKNGNAIFECMVLITNTDQLKKIFEKIRKIKGVISVDRSSI